MVNIEYARSAKNKLKEAISYRNLLSVTGKLDRAVVQCSNNAIFVVWQLWGDDDRNDESVLVERNHKLAELLSSYFDSRFEFTFDFNRIHKEYDLPRVQCSAELVNAQKLQNLRYERFSSRTPIFENQIYFSLSYTPKNKMTGRTAEVITTAHIEELTTAVGFCEAYFPLCGFSYELLKENSLITYLYRTVTNDFLEKVSLQEPDGDINTAFASVIDIWPSTVPLRVNNNIIQCIPLTYFPSRKTWNFTFTNMFEAFSMTSHPLRIVAKYRANSQQEGEELIYKRKQDLKKHMFKTSLTGAVSSGIRQEGFSEDEIDLSVMRGVAGCDNAIIHQQEDNLANGFFSFTLILSSDWEKEGDLETWKKSVIEILSRLGIKVVDSNSVRISNTAMFFSTFISGSYNHKDNVRLSLADNVAATFLVGSTATNYKSPHLETITHSPLPHLIGFKADGSLFKFSLAGATGTYGHTFLAGETGGGKSVFLSYMANEWLKYDNTRVVFIDMGLSCLKTVLRNGGKLYYPGLDSTAFCPFKNARDRQEQVRNFVEAIARGNGFKLSPAERKRIKEVVDVMPYGKEDFETFFALFKGEEGDTELVQALQQYIEVYGNYFNAKEDSFINLPRATGIEMSRLLSNQPDALVFPALVYVFDCLERHFTPENPVLLILDEAWAYLKNDFFASYIEKWLKQLRKKNVFVVLATQQIRDLINSPLRDTVLDNVHTRIYLSNEKAEEPALKESYLQLGLTDNDIHIIGTLPRYTMLVSQEKTFSMVSWNIKEELDCIDRDRELEKKLEHDLEGKE